MASYSEEEGASSLYFMLAQKLTISQSRELLTSMIDEPIDCVVNILEYCGYKVKVIRANAHSGLHGTVKPDRVLLRQYNNILVDFSFPSGWL